MKTTSQILTDIYKFVNANTSIIALSGGVYKSTRPTDSTLEDCVIHLIGGSVAKFLQAGTLFIKIFYKDLYSNNMYIEDFAKANTLEALLFTLSESLKTLSGISFEVATREIYTEAVQDINQHYAILRIKFILTTN